MSKQILNCELAARDAMKAAIWERSMFCAIMGIGDGIYNSFIGCDPHGIADLQDGTYTFSMSDVHTVVSEYKRWLQFYGDNDGIAKAVRQWYYLSIDWHEKHPPMEWQDSTKVLPNVDKNGVSDIVLLSEETGHPVFAWYCNTNSHRNEWLYRKNGYVVVLNNNKKRYWLSPSKPDGIYCPNLRSWLMGCPVEGLREATPEWKEEQRKTQEAARQRVEECKQALEDAIKEEVKLNKF